MRIALLVISVFLTSVAVATDKGPLESTPPTVEPRAPQGGTPAVVTTVPGPLPDERGAPAVKPKSGSGERHLTPEERQKRITQINLELKRKPSTNRRKALEYELQQLQLDRMVSPDPAAVP